MPLLDLFVSVDRGEGCVSSAFSVCACAITTHQAPYHAHTHTHTHKRPQNCDMSEGSSATSTVHVAGILKRRLHSSSFLVRSCINIRVRQQTHTHTRTHTRAQGIMALTEGSKHTHTHARTHAHTHTHTHTHTRTHTHTHAHIHSHAGDHGFNRGQQAAGARGHERPEAGTERHPTRPTAAGVGVGCMCVCE